MPQSRHEPSDALLPETPAGYRDPEQFRYSTVLVTGLSLLLLYLGATGFGWVLFEVHPPGALEPLVTADETGFTIELSSREFLVAFVGALIVLVVVHEGVHGLVYRFRGYDLSYGSPRSSAPSTPPLSTSSRPGPTTSSSVSRPCWSSTPSCYRCCSSRFPSSPSRPSSGCCSTPPARPATSI